MAHSLTLTPISVRSNKTTMATTIAHVPSPRFRTVSACHGDSIPASHIKFAHRRSVSLGMGGALLLGLSMGAGNANAAARRPPPPPPEEKKDPNVSGVQAKVLASKKRKEALKESVAKLREKGKTIINQKRSDQE